MMLPIAMKRTAPEGTAPPTHDATVSTPEGRAVFGRALKRAMHGEETRSRESRAGREARRSSEGGDSADSRRLSAERTHHGVHPMTVAHEADVETSRVHRPTAGDPARDAAETESAARDATEAGPGSVERPSIDLAADLRTTLVGTLASLPSIDMAATSAHGRASSAMDAHSTFVAQSLEEVLTARPEPNTSAFAAELAAAGASGAFPLAADSAVGTAPSADRTRTGRSARMSANNLEGLVPDMRTRLERVIERMESEYGYTVDVVETVRSQERQDALFAQGRTTPGPVVTWTRNSRHLDGRAADVTIDGGYDNAAGFEQLARVAREEGLRTLWPRDPGHVELPGSSRPSGARPASTAIPHAVRAGVDPSSGRVAPPAMPPVPDMPDLPDLPGMPHMPHMPLMPELSGVTASRDSAPSVIASPVRAPTIATPTRLAEPATGATGVPVVRRDVVERALAGRTARSRAHDEGALAAAAFDDATSAAATGVQDGIARVARVATVAPVADTARVARVARVADVAVPGRSAPATGPAAGPTNGSGTLMPGQVIASQGGAAGGSTFGHDHGAGGDRGGAGRDAREDGMVHALPVSPVPEGGERTPAALARELLPPVGAHVDTGSGDGSPVAGLARSDATERIARVLRLQEAGSERPLSSVLLRLENPDGGEDRIRIDMRGRSIGATLDVADARAAEQLRAHVPELQEALQRQGLEGDGLVVRSASRNLDVATLSASAVSAERDLARAASATASDGGGSTARDSRNPPRASHERDAREGTDQQRSRQRRDGKEERQ